MHRILVDPITDAFMHRLMSQGLMENKQLKSLHIVDVRDDLMRERRKQRYREVFQVYDNVNKDRNRVWIGEFDDGAKTFFDEFISDPENAIKTNSWESLQDYVK